MPGFNWPIAIYDFLGVLVPGLGLGAILSFVLPSLPRFYAAYPVPMLLLAFVAGHVVQGLSKLAYGLVGRVWHEKTFWEASAETLREEVLEGLTGLSLALILFALFTTRSRFFRKHADSTVYHSFLAYSATAPKPAP